MASEDDEVQPVKITLRDIYEVVVRLDRQNISVRLSDHEDRIRALEKQVWLWSGGAALAGALAGTFLSIIMKG